MAVELAKVSLWLEALEPGKPLNFLDAHIKQGNGLIGATPALIAKGIPDNAFKVIEGDDPKFAASLKRANAKPVQDSLFSDESIYSQSNEVLAAELARIADAPDGSLRQVHAQAAEYREWTESEENRRKHLIADAWCAAFVWIKRADAPPAIVNRVFSDLQEKGGAGIPPETLREIERLREEYDFFHWHLEFPDIFHVYEGNPDADEDTGWSGGFMCVLANPPWDKVDFEDKKYFSAVEPSIAALAGQGRRTRILEWERRTPGGGQAVPGRSPQGQGHVRFRQQFRCVSRVREGLTAPGVNSLQTDQLFAERFAAIIAPTGRVGCIIPTAIATGAGGQYLFGRLHRARRGRLTVRLREPQGHSSRASTRS